MDGLVRQAYSKSIELLAGNASQWGYAAAPLNPVKPSYQCLFGRDSSLCALATVDHADPRLVTAAVASLTTLRQARSPLGQVPFRFDPQTGYKDFWFPGNVDSTLWWVIASLRLVEVLPSQKNDWHEAIGQSLLWLRYQDVAEIGLLMQGRSSDWADEMPSQGAVLYSNALWYRAVSDYIRIYGPDHGLDGEYVRHIYSSFNAVFWPYDDNILIDQVTNKAVRRCIDWAKTDLVQQPYYIQYLSRRSYGWRCDVLGNILSLSVGLADDSKRLSIERHLGAIQDADPYPGKALSPAIYPGDPDWQQGMLARNQNVPDQYHNGGIWPYIGGLWTAYLAGQDRQTAEANLVKLAKANAVNQWEFNEYFHGLSGAPMGISYQSWNAATYIMAYKRLFSEETVAARRPLAIVAGSAAY